MLIAQVALNTLLFIISIVGLIYNRRNILVVLICIELMLLSVNLNFVVASVYLNDFYGQIFSLFILTIAAAESAIGLAIIILYYKIRGTIVLNSLFLIKK